MTVKPSISHLVTQLAAGQRLSSTDTSALARALDECGTYSSQDAREDYYYLTAIVALMARGPSTEELAGIVSDIADRSIDLRLRLGGGAPLVDISGTGGDAVETPNVGSLASFVAAAGGVGIAKQATRAFTGVSGSSDVFKLLGLDVMLADLDQAIALLRTVGLTAIHTPSHSAVFARRMRILGNLRAMDLRFVTPWHLVSWVYSPFPLTGRVYGVFSDEYRKPVADLFQRRCPHQHTLVVYGQDGIDEISASAPTVITELRGGHREEYTVTPASLGLQQVSTQETSVYGPDDFARIQASDLGLEERKEIRQRAAAEFPAQVFRILSGRGSPGHEALIAANAGAALYVGGATQSLVAGTALALELLRSGAVREAALAFAEACRCPSAAAALAKSRSVVAASASSAPGVG